MKKLSIIMITLAAVQGAFAQEAVTPQQLEARMKEYPVLFQQQSAEYRALCYQAFNMATLRLNAIPKKQFKKEKLAIITDLDETILDNSYNDAQLIKDGQSYTPQLWKNWTDKSAATAVPGAVAFLQAAKQKGVHIFYISNRSTSEVQTTLLNLQKLQLPDADTSHMLFLSNTSSKEARRQIVMKEYNVVMLMGDNLTDFTTAFEKNSSSDRKAEADKVQDEWGKKFIVLPNATYGEWENAVYEYKRGLSHDEKEALRQKTLIGY